MRAVAITLVVLTAGCFTPDSRVVTPEGGAPADTSRDADEYWMVWVHGNESEEHGPLDARAMCSIVFDHEIDVSRRAVVLGERYADWSGAQVMVAFDHFDDGDCPLAYEVHLDKTRVIQPMGQAGSVAIAVHANGTVLLDSDTWIPVGTRVRVGYEGDSKTSGEYAVEALGAWPRDGIRSQ